MNTCKAKASFIGTDKYNTNKKFNPLEETYRFSRYEIHHLVYIYFGFDNYIRLTESEFSKYFKVIKEDG